MSEEGHLIKAAVELSHALNRAADENLPGKLAGIVKLHAKLAVGSAFIPIPGADVAAAGVNIWTMYVRINKELGLPFTENVMKSLASGIVTNVAGAAAGFLVVGSALKFVPGLGSLGGAALMAGTTYALTIGSGFVYMKAVTKLLGRTSASTATEQDLRSAADEVMVDRAKIKDVLQTARDNYKRDKDKVVGGPSGIFRKFTLEPGIDDVNGAHIRLHFSFTLRGCVGRKIEAIGWFYDAHGQQLRDLGGDVTSAGGVSIAGPELLIQWDPADCDGWYLTMPLKRLRLAAGQHTLKCNVGIYCRETNSFATTSQLAQFDATLT